MQFVTQVDQKHTESFFLMTRLSTVEQAASSVTMQQQCHLLCNERSSEKNTLSAYRFSEKALCILNIESMVTAQICEVCVSS
jgi:hypothetical protein